MAGLSSCIPRQSALRDIDFDLCVNTDVVNDVLESESNEIELVVAEDSSKAHGALRADTLGARFELMEVLSRDVEASSELGEGLLVRLTDTGKELGKSERPSIEGLEKSVGGSVEMLGLGGSFLGGHVSTCACGRSRRGRLSWLLPRGSRRGSLGQRSSVVASVNHAD